MREEVSRSRKILSSCPMHLRSEREQEIERLERAVKRMEGLVNRDRQEAIQQKAFANIKHEEKEKQKQGKGQWFLKDCKHHHLRVLIRLINVLRSPKTGNHPKGQI